MKEEIITYIGNNPVESVEMGKEIFSSLFGSLIEIGTKIGESKSEAELEKYREEAQVRIAEIEKEKEIVKSDSNRMKYLSDMIVQFTKMLEMEQDADLLQNKTKSLIEIMQVLKGTAKTEEERLLCQAAEIAAVPSSNQGKGFFQKFFKKNISHNEDIVPME